MRPALAALVFLASCGRKEPAPAAPQAEPAGLAVLEIVEENEDTLRQPFEIAHARAASAGTRLEVRLVRRYSGGRRGVVEETLGGGTSMTLPAPNRPKDGVLGGLVTPLADLLAKVRVWPGDLAIRRDGDAVILTIDGKETRLRPGEEATLGEASLRARVRREILDEGFGEPARPGVRRLDLGDIEFRTRLRARYVELRT